MGSGDAYPHQVGSGQWCSELTEAVSWADEPRFLLWWRPCFVMPCGCVFSVWLRAGSSSLCCSCSAAPLGSIWLWVKRIPEGHSRTPAGRAFCYLLLTPCSLPSECWEQTIRICEHRKVVAGLNWIKSTMTGPGVFRLLELPGAFLLSGLSTAHWLSARGCAWHFIPGWNIMTEKLHISYNINNSAQNSKNSLCRVFRHLRNGFHFHQSEARHVSLVQMGYYCSRSCGCFSLRRTCCYREDSVPSSWAAWLDGA